MKIKIAGQYWEWFSDFTLSSDLDAVASKWSFTTFFDPDNALHQKLLKPLQFFKVEFFHDDGSVFSTGTLLCHRFLSKADPELVQLSGYSLGGVLENCEIPYSAYPLESNNRTLEQIATRLFKLFGLNLIVYPTAQKACSENIEKSVAEPQETVKAYISKIAAQKNVIFSHDIHGNLIFFQPDPKAVTKLFLTKGNTVSMELNVDGQGLHSILTTLRQPAAEDSDGLKDGLQLTGAESITNPLVNAFRPHVTVLTSGNVMDTGSGVENEFAAELMNIQLAVMLDSWQQSISIGDFVDVMNPEVYLYSKTRMMIQNITFNENAQSKTMTLGLVLPEAFTAGQPKKIFG